MYEFSSLASIFNSDSHQYIKHPRNFHKEAHLLYDTVHIMENIRNKLLNEKQFIFLELFYNDGLNIDMIFPADFIQ